MLYAFKLLMVGSTLTKDNSKFGELFEIFEFKFVSHINVSGSIYVGVSLYINQKYWIHNSKKIEIISKWFFFKF